MATWFRTSWQHPPSALGRAPRDFREISRWLQHGTQVGEQENILYPVFSFRTCTTKAFWIDFELTSFFSGCISYYTRLFMFQQHNPFIKLEASMLPYATAPHIKETQRSGVFETAAGWNSLSKYHITLNSCFMIVCDEYIDHICQTSRSFS